MNTTIQGLRPAANLMVVAGLSALALGAWSGASRELPWLFLAFGCFVCATACGLFSDMRKTPASVYHQTWVNALGSRSAAAWLMAAGLTVFYLLLYWFPETLGLAAAGKPNAGLIALFDPLSRFLNGKEATQWFVYGVCYTAAIVLMGIRFMTRFRHARYQVIRTLSVMFFQLVFAFLLPELMLRLNLPYNDFKNAWPLNYYFFDGAHISELLSHGGLGQFILVWGIVLSAVLTPVLTYLFGKRWYCSWVCGCGALAETAGDPFRHLSNKKIRAWKFERYSVYLVLLFAVVMTGMVLYTFFTGNPRVLFIDAAAVRSAYGFLIGAAFSGVIGVGFYPLLGGRVWCRFGCPMAALLGILQKHCSRFQITTNGGQCISCGNCSVYCEMGIDVRAYAQEEKPIVRASCVGCGICSAVCPRGVLKLENIRKEKAR